MMDLVGRMRVLGIMDRSSDDAGTEQLRQALMEGASEIERLQASLDVDHTRREARADALRESAARIDEKIKKEQPSMTRQGQELSAKGRPSTGYAIRRADLDARISCRDTILALIDKPHPSPAETHGTPIIFTYRNWRGETDRRTIVPTRVWYGSTEWHPEPQWLLSGYDLAKAAHRDFALVDCTFPETPHEPHS